MRRAAVRFVRRFDLDGEVVVIFSRAQFRPSTKSRHICPRISWAVFAVALWALLFATSNAFAQDETNTLLQSSTRPAKLRVPQASQRTPLFWADGIMRSDQLELYARAGFNTVIVRLFWAPTEDGSIVASDLEPQRDFARAAADLDLKIIYSLPPSPFGQEKTFRMSGGAGPYRLMWANWTQRAIAQLKNTPNLIGWMLPDDPRSLPFANANSFSRWIATNYSSVEVLNRQWQTNFETLDAVTLPATRKLIAAWRGPGKLTNATTGAQIRDYIEMAAKRPANQNFAFHPASLALANYQWDEYRTLLDFWAQTARIADPSRVIFSGRLPDYAQLLSLPASIDVSLPFLSPGQAEADLASHNSQAIDIARRGGRFLVAPVLSTHIPGLSPDVPARLVAAWADAALAHGSIGIGFDSWDDILQNRPLRRAIGATIKRLQNEEYSVLWGLAPASTSAIVLTPLADGITLHPRRDISEAMQPNQPPEDEQSTLPPRGLYGFGEDMIEGEPTALVAALHWGSAFGSVDYLSPDDLNTAYSLSRGGVLRQYSAVLLPQAMSVPLEMAQELAGYVNGGGVIVADLGLSAVQNGGSAAGLSPEMRALMGVVPTKLQTVAFNLSPGEMHPLLPTWSGQAAMRAGTLTAGDGPQGAAFAGPVALGDLMPGTVPIARAFQMTERLAGKNLKDPRDDVTRLQVAWLTLRPYGNGFALFAPFRMWSSWFPGQLGYDGFHGDLLARGATLTHVGVQSLTSQPLGTPQGTTNFVEAINYPNAIALLNHDATAQTPYGERIFDNSNPSAPATIDENDQPIIGGAPGELAIVPLPEASEDAKPTIEATPHTSPELAGQNSGGSTPVPPITTLPDLAPLPDSAPGPAPTPAPPTAPAQGSKPVIVQTSGAEYFLWSEAICVFPVGAVLPPTPGRISPVQGAQNEFMLGNIVRPPMYNPLILHTYIAPLEMKVLRALPIRIINTQGGPLAARVAEYNARQIAMRVWPNSESALPSGTSWRVALGKEGIVRVSVFDKKDGYAIEPGSRHFIAVTENVGERGTVRATENFVLEADEQGRLNFELKGTLLGVLIRPASAGELPVQADPKLPQANVTFKPFRFPAGPAGRDVNPDSPDFHKKYN